jgi:hypothetical protein
MEVSTRAKRRPLNAMTIVVVIVSAVTVAWPAWFETLTGDDPDGGDGSFERWVVRGLAIVALVAVTALGRAGRRRRSSAVRLEGASSHG